MSDNPCTPEFEDASFCKGDSNQNANPYSPEDPSSDTGVTQEEIDYCVENYPGTYPDEHTGECTEEALIFEIKLNNPPEKWAQRCAEAGVVCGPDEEDSSAEPSEQSTTTSTAQPQPVETLPQTGIADFSGLALVGATLIAMGGMILRRT